MNANVPTALALNGQQGQKVSITLEKKGYKIGCKFWRDSLVVSWLSPTANPQLKIGSRILGYSNFDELYTFLLNASYPLTLTFDLPRSVAVSTQNETDTVPQALGPELRLVASHKKQGKDTKWRHKPIPMVNWPGWKKISGKIPMQYMSPEGVVFSTIQVANLYKKLLKLEQTEVMAWHEFKLWHGKRLFKGKPLIDYVKRAPRFDIPKQYIKCKQEDSIMDDLSQQASKASIVGPGGFHFLSEASAKEFQEMFFSEGTVAMAWHLFKQKKKSTLMSHICGLPSWAIGTKPLEAQTREATKQLGPEWQVKTMARQSGKSANKAYYYYYSPILKQRFRSLARAKTFRAIVEECGSESKALKRLINKKKLLFSKKKVATKKHKKISSNGVKGSTLKMGVSKKGQPKPRLSLSKNNLAKKKGAKILVKKKPFLSKKKVAGAKSSSNGIKPLQPFADTSTHPFAMNGHVPHRIVFNDRAKQNQFSFLHLLFKNRVMEIEYDLGSSKTEYVPEREFRHPLNDPNGTTYELVSSKYDDNGQKFNASHGAKKKKMVLSYVATKGPDLQEIDLQSELENISNFAALKACKAASRLQLMQTQTTKGNAWPLKASKFELIADNATQGCGFIPETILQELLGSNTRVESMVVRIFSAKLGTFKGMLFKVPFGDKIQLPPSMMKVGASVINKKDFDVTLISKGSYPSSLNQSIGRMLDPDQKSPNWTTGVKDLSRWYIKFIGALGVPDPVLKKYKNNAKEIQGMKHAHLKGVVDPFGKLPQGCVFISGYAGVKGKRQRFGQANEQVFVTKSPVLDPSDARLLSVVKDKPSRMTASEWKFLCNLEFGHIIFAVPENEQMAPLPTLLGGNDLDGDEYFTLWDKTILEHLQTNEKWAGAKLTVETISNINKDNEGLQQVMNKPDWLAGAQSLMLDFNHFNNTNELVGKLWGQCWKVAEEKEGGLFDRDARAFAAAYHDSLDVRKHGGKIYLPEKLHEKVGPKYRELVTGRRISDPDDVSGESLPTQLENSFQDSFKVAEPAAGTFSEFAHCVECLEKPPHVPGRSGVHVRDCVEVATFG